MGKTDFFEIIEQNVDAGFQYKRNKLNENCLEFTPADNS
jgi:hypothetical protein